MSDFHDALLTVHREIWESGTAARADLCHLLSDLADAPLPPGVARLPTAAMSAGPHLAAQDEFGDTSRDVIWLEAGRLARQRTRRFAML